MADQIPQIPGGPGTSLVNLIPQNNDAAVAGGYIVEIGQVLTMFGGPLAIAGVAAIAVGVLIEVFADIIQAFVPGLAGRPKQEATWEAAKRLMSAKNGAARLYGVILMRLLKDDDIVISDSDPAHQNILGKANHQFVMNLEAQGVSLNRARQIAVNALSRGAQAGAPLEKELAEPTPSSLYFTGPQSILAAYQIGYLHGQELGYVDPKLSLYAQKYAVLHGPLRDMLRAQWTKTPPTTPTTPDSQNGNPQPFGSQNWLTLPNPPQNPNCEGSYKLDPQTGQYTPAPYCGMVPAGYNYDPATDTATPGATPDDEAIAASQDLSYGLAAIAYWLKQQAQAAGNLAPATTQAGSEADCCTRIVDAINGLAGRNSRDLTGTTPDGSTPATVEQPSGVIAILEQIETTFKTFPALAQQVIQCVCAKDDPDGLAAQLKRIADEMTRTPPKQDFPARVNIQALIDQAAKIGAVAPDLAQSLSN